jgi:membrane-associated protein
MSARLRNLLLLTLVLFLAAAGVAAWSLRDTHAMRTFLQLFSSDGIMDAVRTGGPPLVIAIVFVETGLLVGFFLPGDSLLVVTGLVAADPGTDWNVWLLFVLLGAAAIVGDAVGFWIGSRAGPALFTRDDSLFFKRKHLERAHAFYEKHGGKAIVLGRFVPIVRTFVPTVAGAAGMDYRRFVLFNVAGGIGWVGSMLLTGWAVHKFFEKTIGKDQITHYLHLIIGVVIFLSVLPIAIGWLRTWRAARAARASAPFEP